MADLPTPTCLPIGIQGRDLTDRRRAEEAEAAYRLAEDENIEWRAGNIRVVTYKKWKEERDDERRARGEDVPLSEEQLAAEAAAQVERAVAGGAQGAGALPLGPLPADEQRGSGATVSTVELTFSRFSSPTPDREPTALEDGARSY